MRVVKIRSEGLSHLSYFVHSGNDAFVVDPRRDIDVYVKLAEENDCEIKHIFETHRNEDYVIGSLELKNRIPSARIGHSDAIDFEFGDDSIPDGETIAIGAMKITCTNTPGHTPDSMCYAVADESVSTDPIVVFTGDTLFVNEVGRTDLVDPDRTGEFAEVLYESLHEKVLPLGDHVIIHPAHGAGSVCGGDIGEREFSTIGYEKRNNKWLSMDRDEFVKHKLEQKLILSPYFKHCEKLNTIGPPLLSDRDPVRTLDVDTFEEMRNKPKHVVIDTRDPKAYLEGHIPDSISSFLGAMGMIAGWVFNPDDLFLLILSNPADMEETRSYLIRVGYDNVLGYLARGFEGWKQAGNLVSSMKNYEIPELKERLDKGGVQIVDVRQPHEYHRGTMKDSHFIPLTSIDEKMGSLEQNKEVITICPSGIRSTTAASILKRNGFEKVGVPVEGLKSWREAGLPLEKD